MKKKVFLVLVLALIVAGGAFADSVLSKVVFDNGGISGITITAAETRSSMLSLAVTYTVNAAEALGVVKFVIFVYYTDPTNSNPSYRAVGESMYYVDTNREVILRRQTSGTWTWSLPREVFYNLTGISIRAEK